MPGALEITLNRDRPHAIDVATRSFEVDGSFDIVLDNRGAALHVHLHLDDDLSRAAKIATSNHYVDGEHVRHVRVDVADGAAPASGRLKIVTGYGTETAYVTVSVIERAASDRGVVVDERLAKPQPKPSEPALDPEALPVVALGAVALLIAALATLALQGGAVVLGGLAVLVGIGIAGILLLR